jgi:hypothetical protein
VLTAFDFFQACQFLAGTRCARRIHMESVLGPYLSEHEYSRKGVAEGASGLQSKLKEVKVVTTADQARMTLALEELDMALSFVSDNRELLDALEAFKLNRATLTECANSIRTFYLTRRIEIPEVGVYLVDELPRPYNTKGYSALTADEGDRKRYGIEPGIYCLPKAITPVLIEYMIAHEFIHAWLGGISADDPCTIFEEGLGEYLSVFGYMASIYGRPSSNAFYRYYRLNSACGSRYDTYVDGLRQVVGIIGTSGYANMMLAANQGRPEFNRLLSNFVNAPPGSNALAGFRNDSTPEQWIMEDYYDALNTAMVFPRSLIVSAEAFLVGRAACNDMTIREVAEKCSMTEELTRKAMTELDERALATLRADGQVVSRNLASAHLEIGHLRYDFR